MAAPDSASTIEEIVAALAALPDGATVADAEPHLLAVAAALIGADRLAVAIARAKLTEVLRNCGLPGPAALADAACGAALHPSNVDDDVASGGQGQALVLEDAEPCDEVVVGATMLDDLVALVQRYVVLSIAAAHAVALWIVHTYATEACDISARLVVTSPRPRCGKSTLLDLLGHVVRRALGASNITPAAMFRVIEACSPTLLVDEADTFLAASDELRGIVNAGHARGGGVIRTVGEDHEPRRFGVYGALALAAIGKVPATIADRALEIRLARKLPGERVSRLNRATIGSELEPLRRRLARWTDDYFDTLRTADPVVPGALHDRQADGWRPLLAIAEAAGGGWAAKARAAALALAGAVDSDAEDIRTLLLADLRDIFGTADRMPSDALVSRLGAMADRPWAEWGKMHKPMTQVALASVLRSFDVRPCGIRVGEETPRGYLREHLQPIWDRYLSDPRPVDDPDAEDDGSAADEVAA